MDSSLINIDKLIDKRALERGQVQCISFDNSFFENEGGTVFRVGSIVVTIVDSGVLHYEVAGRRGMVKSGCVLITPPFAELRHIGSSSDFASRSVFIPSNFFDSTLERNQSIRNVLGMSDLESCPAFPLDEDDYGDLSISFYHIRKAVEGNKKFSSEIISCLVEVFLMLLSRNITTEDTYTVGYMRKDTICRMFLHNAHKYFRSERKVSFYADILCISSDYLSRSVKDVSGKTPLEHLNNMLFEEICQQLTLSDHTISEIAVDLNFSDQSALTKFFKQHAGVSPLSYRKTGGADVFENGKMSG